MLISRVSTLVAFGVAFGASFSTNCMFIVGAT